MKKRCSKCGKEKPYSEFYKKKAATDGLTSACKICDNETSLQYRKDHREEKSEYNLQYRKDHLEELHEKDRQHYKDHLEEKLEYHHQYKKDHRKERNANDQKDRDELNPPYIKQLIRQKHKIPSEFISNELIDDYRGLLIMERLTNERRKEESRAAVKRGIIRPNRTRRP